MSRTAGVRFPVAQDFLFSTASRPTVGANTADAITNAVVTIRDFQLSLTYCLNGKQ
jgi:hypothetical protein